MVRRLAVSDSQRGLILSYSLPDLEPAAPAFHTPAPGRLAAGELLYCAGRTDAAVTALRPDPMRPVRTFAAGPEVESLLLSHDGAQLYALSGGASRLHLIDAHTGALMKSADAGVSPRALALSPAQEQIAVADGIGCRIDVLCAQSLRPVASFPVSGIACGAAFFAGSLYALCAEGEYDLRAIVGFVDARGKWRPQVALPGLPGAMTPCGGGLLVGHLGWLTMLDVPSGRIRWQTRMGGLPTQLLDLGRLACYADEADGCVGLVDLRQGRLMRRVQLGCPGGLAAL